MVRSYRGRQYEVISYQKIWVRQFRRESGHIQKIFGDDALAIRHIGGTSIPGLASKPTLDILVIVPNISVVRKHIAQLNGQGYKSLEDYVRKGSFLFIKEKHNIRLFNVHFFPGEHAHVAEMTRMRDYLRRNPREARTYGRLKEKLFGKYPAITHGIEKLRTNIRRN